MDVTIRPVRPTDALGIAALLNRIVAGGHQGATYVPVSIEDQADFLRAYPGRGIFNVAVTDDDGTILGVQDILPVEEEAHSVGAHSVGAHSVGAIATFVTPDRHRTGIGTQLGQVTLPAARDRGYTALRATIRADNAAAVAFYRRLGFAVVGMAEEPMLVRGEPVDVLIARAVLAA